MYSMGNDMKKCGLLVLVILCFAQINSTIVDYATMSQQELNTAFKEAVRNGSLEEVQKLVQAGADIRQKVTYTVSHYDDYDREVTCTYLEYAAKHNLVDVVKVLMQLSFEQDEINTALIVAAQEGNAGVVKELIKAKPSVDAINRAVIVAAKKFPGITAHKATGRLHWDALKGYWPVIKELIEAGAHGDYVDDFGRTALIIIASCSLYSEAQKKHRAEIIQALLKAKANVNHVDKNGETALIKAIQKHSSDAVEILLQVPGINLNYVDNNGNTALIIAVQSIQTSYIAGREDQLNACKNSQYVAKVVLEAVVKTPGNNLHHVNKNGDTAVGLIKKKLGSHF